MHNALGLGRLPIAEAASSDGAAVITGLPGIGKTFLARAYGWLFGSAYPGGIFRVSAGGAGGITAARDRYLSDVRRIAQHLGIPVSGEQNDRVIDLVAEYLSGQDGTSLWIVDDLPAGVNEVTLGQFVIPARSARTLFTARVFGGGAREIPLTGLVDEDGLAVLRAARPIKPADLAAATAIVRGLGGHPLALGAAAGRLRDTDGLISYTDYAQSLTGDSDFAGIVTEIGRSTSSLMPADHIVIALAGLTVGAPLPAALIGAVLAACPPAGTAGGDAGQALRRLRRGGFARSDGPAWMIHPLVVEAAARSGPPPVPVSWIAATAARELAALLSASPDEPLLSGSAQLLAGCAGLADAALADTLRRLVAGHRARAGDLAKAAALRQQVCERNPSSGADAVAAARACADNGEYSRAVAHARNAARLGVTGDLAVEAEWALAAGLDGLGHFGEAEPLWAALSADRWSPDPAQQTAFDTARARAMLARGRLAQARSILEPLLAGDHDAHPDLLNAARIEMARLLLWTSREGRGRELASSVVRYYQDRKAPGHSLCLEAELVWAEAAVSLELFDLRPDTSQWAQAEQVTARLAADYPQLAGPHSAHGLAAAVLRGLLLVWLGRQRECRDALQPAIPAIEAGLGPRHPLALRARYALGLAHLQLTEYGPAAEVLGAVWEAQQEVIGPAHPDTLHTQLQYGIALKLAGGPGAARSARVISGVLASMPEEIGRRNDLYAQAWLARALRWAPQPAVTALLRLDRLLGRDRGRDRHK